VGIFPATTPALLLCAAENLSSDNGYCRRCAAYNAVLAGNADVGSSAQFTFSAMLQKGGKFKIISQICTSGKYQCAVAEADILKPGDLLGRTVATQFGAMGQYHADRYYE
jgi:hypothetical protein